MSLVDEFLRGSTKAQALASVDDPNVTDAGSIPYKMLSSVIYDLGKELGARCQLDHGAAGYRDFFDDVVAHFLAAFPNIDKYGDKRVEGTANGRAYSNMRFFVRARLQQSFSQKNYKNLRRKDDHRV